MNKPSPVSQDEGLRALIHTTSPERQLALRNALEGDNYYRSLSRVYLENPFFRLTNDELKVFRDTPNPSPLRDLIVAREMATRSLSPKVSVFCMPKSGSSFVQSALQHALQLPLASMTSFGSAGVSSYFGMNSREQELDELAIIKAILQHPGGFVAQNHTRYSMYLARQMAFYRISSVVTVRNILDCIVSFDEMTCAWRDGKGADGWLVDAQFPLPLDYPELSDEVRYDLLARSFGVWLIGFYLSWKRCTRQAILKPLVVSYEEHVLDPDRFVETLASGLGLSAEQRERLEAYAASPDRKKSRLRHGVAGRGRALIAPQTVQTLREHAALFRGEITDAEIDTLLR